jgi:hypothetical protein
MSAPLTECTTEEGRHVPIFVVRGVKTGVIDRKITVQCGENCTGYREVYERVEILK